MVRDPAPCPLSALQASAKLQVPLVGAIGIGVQKAATSWLFRCLTQHPQLQGAMVDGGDKELNFFNRYFEYGYDWYEDHFEAGEWQNMEFSVLYFHDRDVPARIRRYNPEVRLLLCLRNPVDRALSQYRHEIRHGRVKYAPGGFWRALERNPSYIEQGLYGAHLERWLDHFDLGQFHIVHYDRVQNDPIGVLDAAFEFLGVNSGFRPSIAERRANRSVVQGDGVGHRTLHLLARGVRLVAGPRIHRRLRASRLAEPIQRYRYTEVGGKDELPEHSPEREALAECFRPDLERLGSLLGTDYANWC